MICSKCKGDMEYMTFQRTFSSKAYFVDSGEKLVLDESQTYTEVYICPICNAETDARGAADAVTKLKDAINGVEVLAGDKVVSATKVSIITEDMASAFNSASTIAGLKSVLRTIFCISE